MVINMNMGTAMLISAAVGAFSFVIKGVFENLVSGLWIKHAGEVVPGDRITVKTDFEEKTGTVKEVHLRNVVVELESGEDLLIEATKVFEEDVIRERNNEEKE